MLNQRAASFVGLWLLGVVACSAALNGTRRGLTNQVPMVIAKLSRASCNPDVARSAAASGGPAVGLSAATVSAVQARAAAVGLKYDSDLGVPCWVLLKPAETREATQAAIQSLQGPSADVMSESGVRAASDNSLFEIVGEETFKYTTVIKAPPKERKWTKLTGKNSKKLRRKTDTTTKAATTAKAGAGLKKPSGLPEECASGTCNKLWGMNRIKAPEAWGAMGSTIPFSSITRKGMIIDNGADPKHWDIAPQFDSTNSRTFSKGSSNQPAGGVAGSDGHGTHVFGTAAGGWGSYNGEADTRGIAGVAGPMYKSMVSCNVFGYSDGASDSDIIRCLNHARQIKAHWAVNLSLGGTMTKGSAPERLYVDAFTDFCSDGGIALIAAGNGVDVTGARDGMGVDVANSGLRKDGVTFTPNQAEYPAYLAKFFPDCVLAIANIVESSNDELAPSSNWGDLVKIAAPGTDILSDVLTSEGGKWAKDSYTGTSMAAPHATGSVILLRNAFPDATNTQVVNCMVKSADKTVTPYWPGSRINSEGGVLNVKAAYDCLKAIFGGGGGGGGGVTPSPPPLVDCTAVTVPICVNAASGKVDPGCIASASSYCQLSSVGGSICRYSYKGSDFLCDSSAGTSCSGSSASCPSGPPPPDACSNPPAVDYATFDSSCAAYTAAGSSCSAACDDGYEGEGYTADCLSGGAWSGPVGGGCTEIDGGDDEVTSEYCGDCSVGGLCTRGDGCYCVDDTVCECSADMGLEEYTTEDEDGVPGSYCTWAVSWPKGLNYKAAKNQKVNMEFNVGTDDNSVCPDYYVVEDVVVDPDYYGVYRCPTENYEKLRRGGSSWLGREVCRLDKVTGQMASNFTFNTDLFSGSKGRCVDMAVITTDGFYYAMTLQYTN